MKSEKFGPNPDKPSKWETLEAPPEISLEVPTEKFRSKPDKPSKRER